MSGDTTVEALLAQCNRDYALAAEWQERYKELSSELELVKSDRDRYDDEKCQRALELKRACERIAELEAANRAMSDDVAFYAEQIRSANARADAAERKLEAEHAAAMTAEADMRRAESEAASLRDRLAVQGDAKEALEETVAALRAEVARLRDELQRERDRRVEHRQMNQSLNEQLQRWDAMRNARDAAEDQLAAANALLEDAVVTVGLHRPEIALRMRAHLSGQAPARTDHDRAVLEAWRGADEDALRQLAGPGLVKLALLKVLTTSAEAELARREADK